MRIIPAKSTNFDLQDMEAPDPKPARIPPHLRRAQNNISPAKSTRDGLERGPDAEYPGREAHAKITPPPRLMATTLSNLSNLSELSLSGTKENIVTSNTKPTETQVEVTDNGQQHPKGKVSANIATSQAADDKTKTFYPHLRPFQRRATSPITNTSKGEGGVSALKTPLASRPCQNSNPSPPLSKIIEDGTIPPAGINNVISGTISTPTAPRTVVEKKSVIQPPASRLPPASQTVSSAWSSFAAAPGTPANRPGRSTVSAYTNPLPTQTRGYGIPVAPRAPIIVDPAMEKTLFFQSWPGVEDRGRTSKPRTVIISELPDDPTLAMVSRICKDTGLLETISLIPASKKALVWFVEADDAQRFYDKTGNGLVLSYERGGVKLKKTVFVEMRKNIDVLPSALRTKVDEAGHTRVIRIVGWEVNDLRRILGIKDTIQEGPEILLQKLAEKYSFEGKTDRVEGVTCHTNSLGHLEATLIFSGMKEAYFTLGQIKRIPALEACNITFGKDP